jgi:hypothetical protein
MAMTTNHNFKTVRTDSSLANFVDRYEKYVLGEISYRDLHTKKKSKSTKRKSWTYKQWTNRK